MQNYDVITLVVCGIAMLMIAALSAIVLKKLRFPHTIGMVVVGTLIGLVSHRIPLIKPLASMYITPNIVLYVLLPTLVFDAALNMDMRLLFRNLTPVMILAAPGLVLATLITGALIAGFSLLPVGPAMLFGALISTTDPVAVIAVFKEIGAPKRLSMLVDGESLFNDATAIVMFNIVMGILAAGFAGASTVFIGAAQFVYIFLGGALVGVVVGRLIILILTFTGDDPLIQVAFSTVVAYAAFIIAQYYLGLSGVMSAVGAGMVLNYYGATRFTPEVKLYLKHFWSFASFAANSFIFLMLGLTESALITDVDFHKDVVLILLVVVCIVTAARAAVVFGLVPLANRLPRANPISMGFRIVIFWGGLRGALPIGLALSLAPDFPHRKTIIAFTMGVVLFTLLAQGSTVGRLIRRLKLDVLSLTELAALAQARLAVRKNVLSWIRTRRHGWANSEALLNRMAVKYETKVAEAEKTLEKTRTDSGFRETIAPRMLWAQAVSVEKQGLVNAFEKGLLSEAALRKSVLSADAKLEQAWAGAVPPGGKPAPVWLAKTNSTLESLIRRAAPAAIERLWAMLEFEPALTEFIASGYVLERLDEMAGACGADDDCAVACRRHYEQRLNAAKLMLDTLYKKHPGETTSATVEMLKRAVFNIENETLETLAARGGITEQAAFILKSDIAAAEKAADSAPA